MIGNHVIRVSEIISVSDKGRDVVGVGNKSAIRLLNVDFELYSTESASEVLNKINEL